MAGAFVLVLSMASLVACGDDEQSTTLPTPEAKSGSAPAREEASQERSAENGEPANDSTGSGSQSESPEPAAPAAGFHDTSGVTDIPAFGSEASPVQRSAARQVLSAYLRATGEGEWTRACAHLSAITMGQLQQVVEQLPRAKDESCGEALRLLLQLGPSYQGPTKLVALRIKEGGGAGDGAGFALFHGNDGIDYWVTMRLEGGQWKVLSTAPQPLH